MKRCFLLSIVSMWTSSNIYSVEWNNPWLSDLKNCPSFHGQRLFSRTPKHRSHYRKYSLIWLNLPWRSEFSLSLHSKCILMPKTNSIIQSTIISIQLCAYTWEMLILLLQLFFRGNHSSLIYSLPILRDHRHCKERSKSTCLRSEHSCQYNGYHSYKPESPPYDHVDKVSTNVDREVFFQYLLQNFLVLYLADHTSIIETSRNIWEYRWILWENTQHSH